MPIDSKQVCQIAVVVKDIHATVKNWSKLLAIPCPAVRTIPKAKEVPAFTHDMAGDYSDCLIAVFALGTITMEFIQPGEKSSPWKTHLETYGEGVQYIGFRVPDREQADKAINDMLDKSGPYHIGFYPNGTYAFYDTKEELGVEINIKSNDNNTKLIEKIVKTPEKGLAEILSQSEKEWNV